MMPARQVVNQRLGLTFCTARLNGWSGNIEDSADSDLLFVPGRNLITGAKTLTDELGQLTSLEEDLLTLATAIFAADVALRRGEREQFTRDFRLQVPVTNHAAFVALQAELIDILYFLTSDNWEVIFLPREGTPEPHRTWPTGRGSTLLFSGGLDSFAAAVDELSANRPLQLVSHCSPSAQVGQNGVIEEERELAHLNRKGAGDEIESGAGFRGRGEDGSGYTAGDPAAVLSRGQGAHCDCGITRRRQHCRVVPQGGH